MAASTGISPAGIYTRGQEVREFVNAATGQSWPFEKGSGPVIKIGRFSITKDALLFAAKTIAAGLSKKSAVDFFIVDEIGRLEFDGKGLHSAMKSLIASSPVPVLCVVRYELLGDFSEVFGVVPEKTWELRGRENQSKILAEILERIRSPRT